MSEKNLMKPVTSMKDVEKAAKKHNVLIPVYNGKEVTNEAFEVLTQEVAHQVWNPNSENKAIMDSFTLDQLTPEDARLKCQTIAKGFELEIKAMEKNFIILTNAKYSTMLLNDERIKKISTAIFADDKLDNYNIDSRYPYGRGRDGKDTYMLNLSAIFNADFYAYISLFSTASSVYEEDRNESAIFNPFYITSYFGNDYTIVSDFAILHANYIATSIIGVLNDIIVDAQIKEILKEYINNFLSELLDGLNAIFSKAYIIAQQYREYGEYKAIKEYYENIDKELELQDSEE